MKINDFLNDAPAQPWVANGDLSVLFGNTGWLQSERPDARDTVRSALGIGPVLAMGILVYFLLRK